MPRIVVSIHIEDFKGSSGSAVTVRETVVGHIEDEVIKATANASSKAIQDWVVRRGQ